MYSCSSLKIYRQKSSVDVLLSAAQSLTSSPSQAAVPAQQPKSPPLLRRRRRTAVTAPSATVSRGHRRSSEAAYAIPRATDVLRHGEGRLETVKVRDAAARWTKGRTAEGFPPPRRSAPPHTAREPGVTVGRVHGRRGWTVATACFHLFAMGTKQRSEAAEESIYSLFTTVHVCHAVICMSIKEATFCHCNNCLQFRGGTFGSR